MLSIKMQGTESDVTIFYLPHSPNNLIGRREFGWFKYSEDVPHTHTPNFVLQQGYQKPIGETSVGPRIWGGDGEEPRNS